MVLIRHGWARSELTNLKPTVSSRRFYFPFPVIYKRASQGTNKFFVLLDPQHTLPYQLEYPMLVQSQCYLGTIFHSVEESHPGCPGSWRYNRSIQVILIDSRELWHIALRWCWRDGEVPWTDYQNQQAVWEFPLKHGSCCYFLWEARRKKESFCNKTKCCNFFPHCASKSIHEEWTLNRIVRYVCVCVKLHFYREMCDIFIKERNPTANSNWWNRSNKWADFTLHYQDRLFQ